MTAGIMVTMRNSALTAQENDPTSIAKAIRESQATVNEFERAFHNRQRCQTGFLVTVLRPEENVLVPEGILVTAIRGDMFIGLSIANTLVGEPGPEE